MVPVPAPVPTTYLKLFVNKTPEINQIIICNYLQMYGTVPVHIFFVVQ
jgi:hypothetical protein